MRIVHKYIIRYQTEKEFTILVKYYHKLIVACSCSHGI